MKNKSGAAADGGEERGTIRTTQREKAGPNLVSPSLQSLDALTCDALAVGVCSDVLPLGGLAAYVDWRMCGSLTRFVRQKTLTGAVGEKILVPTRGLIGPKQLFLFGWGPRARLLDEAVRMFRVMVETVNQAQVPFVAVALPEPSRDLASLVEGHLRAPLDDRLVSVFASS